MHLYRSNVYQDAANLLYRLEVQIRSVEDLKNATCFDYTPWQMSGPRCLANAVSCDVIYHDYDNDHSENQDEWLTIEKCKNEVYKGIEAYYITSRNNEKSKDGKAPRPKFHVFLPTRKITSVELYNKRVAYLKECFPLYDHKTSDAARFFYGFDEPEIDYAPGIDILDWAAAKWAMENGKSFKDDYAEQIYTEPEGKIAKGERNGALKRYAGHIKFEYLDKSEEELFEALKAWSEKKLDPPISETEIRRTVLKSTWREILKARKKQQFTKEATGRTYHLDDIGDAEFLRDKLGVLYKWCDTKKCWLFFKDGVWGDDGDLVFIEAALQAFEVRKHEAKNIKAEADRDIFIAHLMGLRSYDAYSRVLKAARSKMSVSLKEFNKNNFLINCKNGTLDLKTFDFYEHRPEELHSKITGAEYNKQASPPQIFLDFIETTFEGDQELINYVQKLLGFTLTGDVSRQEFYILHGEGGNGKSQLIATLQYILGEYAYEVAAKRIMESKTSNNDTYLAQLRGVRALFCSEGDERAKLDISLVKQLTDENASFNVAQKYEKPQQFKLSLHPFLITNPLPRITENQEATWRRIRLIPFTHRVPEKDRVLNFAARMLEAGASGIFNWYLEGLKKYYAEGLTPPEKVLAVTSKYKDQSDELQQFIDECCTVAPENYVPSNELLDAYKKWSGSKYIVARVFSPKIEAKGFYKKQMGNNRAMSFVGLKLLETVKGTFDD